MTLQNMCSTTVYLQYLESQITLAALRRMGTAIQITCSLSPVIIIFKNRGQCVVLQESFHLGKRQQEEKLTVERIYCRGSDTQGSGIKLSLASSSRHFVVLTCTRTRHRVAERG